MRELTQTNLDPGNCWQTAIACILDVDPEELPDQVAIESSETKSSYWNAIQAYLRVHHGKALVQVESVLTRALKVEGLHVICGPSVRTTPENRVNHCVVGRDGSLLWDPHPSRAGLTGTLSWHLIVPYPDEWKGSHRPLECVCPSCSAETGRRG